MATLLTALMINMIPKNMSVDIVHGLSHNEFKCRCLRKNCHYTLVADSLIKGYEILRLSYGHPLTINSGFRCQEHNSSNGVKGSDTSSHTTGHAIDISTSNMNAEDKEGLIELAKTIFDYVQIYPTFIHCHMED